MIAIIRKWKYIKISSVYSFPWFPRIKTFFCTEPHSHLFLPPFIRKYTICCFSVSDSHSVFFSFTFALPHPISSCSLRSCTLFWCSPRHSGPAGPRWAGGQASGEPSHVRACGDSRASPAQVSPSHWPEDSSASLLEVESTGRRRGRHHQPPPALQCHR